MNLNDLIQVKTGRILMKKLITMFLMLAMLGLFGLMGCMNILCDHQFSEWQTTQPTCLDADARFVANWKGKLSLPSGTITRTVFALTVVVAQMLADTNLTNGAS